MAIAGFDRDNFVAELNNSLSPSRPIESIEHLHGRVVDVAELQRALSMEGRHVFIYGDRGVGKSSLATTIAHQLQGSDQNPIAVSGSPEESFSSIIKNIGLIAQGQSRVNTTESINEVRIGTEFFGSTSTETVSHANLGEQTFTISDAADLLRSVRDCYSSDTVIVVDEFDRIGDIRERNKFADLLKQIGDARIPVRFIFTGIGGSLEELLGAHGSAIRQLHTKELSRLSWDGRWEIAVSAAKAFGLEIPREIYIRIAQISDGYPYYVHLMMEKILWRAFDRQEIITEINQDLFQLGLQDAIESINADLKRPYELLLRQKTQDYEAVAWATADGEDLYASMSGMYGSYQRVMEQLHEQSPLSSSQFRYRVNKLMSEDLGPVLKKDPIHKDFYTYCENMLRGYVRMQAEAAEIELYGEET